MPDSTNDCGAWLVHTVGTICIINKNDYFALLHTKYKKVILVVEEKINLINRSPFFLLF